MKDLIHFIRPEFMGNLKVFSYFPEGQKRTKLLVPGVHLKFTNT